MVTENINIRVRSSGTRVVKRKIDRIGQAANNATRGIFLMQRALFVVGGAGIVRGLANYADTLTTVENRLRLTTSSTANMEAVQKRLFKAATDSRTSFTELADVYSRVALSSKVLGTSQEENIRLTESLAKASIISGASTREANAALVQLGQGLASNRLSGDELRSVLEQLPFVADVIAKSLGVTRGELRALGKEGKITAKTIFIAFREAEGNIDRLFAQTDVTISQAFALAETSFLKFLDAFDDATGTSNAVAKAIVAIGENLDVVAGILGLVAAKFAISFGASLVRRITLFVAGITRSGAALARLSQIQLSSATAQVKSTAATVQNTKISIINAQAKARATAITLAQARAEATAALVIIEGAKARSVATGQFVQASGARARLTAATVALTTAERANVAAVTALTGVRGTLTAAEGTAATARTGLAAASVKQASATTRLAAAFPFLTGAVLGATGALKTLGLFFLTNPVGLAIAAIAAAATAYLLWGDDIKVTEDSVVSLKDAVSAAFSLMGEAFATFQVAWATGWDNMKKNTKVFLDLLEIDYEVNMFTLLGLTRITVNAITGLFVTSFKIIELLWNKLPQVFESSGKKSVNAINQVLRPWIDLAVDGGKATIEWISKLGILGEAIKFENTGSIIPVMQTSEAINDLSDEVDALFANLGRDYVGEGFTAAMEALRAGLKVITDRARKDIADAQGAGTITTGENPLPENPPAFKKGSRDFAAIIKGLERELALEKETIRNRQISIGLDKIRAELLAAGRPALTAAQTQDAAALLLRIQRQTELNEVIKLAAGDQEKLNSQLELAKAAYDSGRITIEQYTAAVKGLKEELMLTSQTFEGGFNASISKSILTAQEFGEAMGGIVVGGIKSAADAIVDFALTGRLNLKALFTDLLSQLLKLAAQQYLLKLLGGFMGIDTSGGGGGGAASGGGVAGFFSKLFGAADGADFTVGGGNTVASLPGQRDNRVLAMRVQDGERVQITPRNKPQSDGVNNTIVMNIQTPDAESFQRSQEQILTRGNAALQRASRRNG